MLLAAGVGTLITVLVVVIIAVVIVWVLQALFGRRP